MGNPQQQLPFLQFHRIPVIVGAFEVSAYGAAKQM